MIKSALIRSAIPLVGGAQRMNFVYVRDVARIIVQCLTDRNALDEVFNVGSKDDVTVEEAVKRLVSLFDTSIKVETEPMRTGETIHFRPNLHKMEQKLGCKSMTPFDEGLQETMKWYQTQRPDNRS